MGRANEIIDDDAEASNDGFSMKINLAVDRDCFNYLAQRTF